VRRKKRRDNVVAKIQKAQNLGVPWRAYQLYLAKKLSQRRTLGEFGSLTAPLWVALRELMGFISLALKWMLPAYAKTRKKSLEEKKWGGWPRSHPEDHR
jgi:hypothetical protein